MSNIPFIRSIAKPTDYKTQEAIEREEQMKSKQHSRSVQATANFAVAASLGQTPSTVNTPPVATAQN